MVHSMSPVVGLHTHGVCMCFIQLCATVVCQIWTPVTSPDLNSCILEDSSCQFLGICTTFLPKAENMREKPLDLLMSLQCQGLPAPWTVTPLSPLW